MVLSVEHELLILGFAAVQKVGLQCGYRGLCGLFVFNHFSLPPVKQPENRRWRLQERDYATAPNRRTGRLQRSRLDSGQAVASSERRIGGMGSWPSESEAQFFAIGARYSARVGMPLKSLINEGVGVQSL